MVHVNKASRTTENLEFLKCLLLFLSLEELHSCRRDSAGTVEVICYWIITSRAKNQSYTVSKRNGLAEVKSRFLNAGIVIAEVGAAQQWLQCI